MTILHSLIFGLVEGITEFLPISSTGHLILTANLLKLSSSEFLKSFEIIIQLGAILAVVVLYWKSFLNISNLKKLFVAFLPTAIIGLALYKIIKHYFLGNSSIVLWSLFLGGFFLIIFELLHKNSIANGGVSDMSKISYKQSFIIGLFQSIAVIPGVSRSAATIVGGLFLGLDRITIVEFSFLLAVPTKLAASGLDLFKNAGTMSSSDIGSLVLGFVVSFVVAMASIRLLLTFVRKYTFIPFGVYRVLVAVAFWLILF